MSASGPAAGLTEITLRHPAGLLVQPAGGGTGTGVLLLAGSSGRMEWGRARLLAQHGVVAMSIRWFGAEGQPPGICEVPIETFAGALDQLSASCDRLAVIGVSKGAEAALLLAAHDRRVDVLAALAPTHVVWANVGPGRDGQVRPCRSSWTMNGLPLPFVRHDDNWRPASDPPAFRGQYSRSMARYAADIPAAVIPVERIGGQVILVAGEDDQVWPSADFARAIVRRRAAHGLPTCLLTDPLAGHRVILPGESEPAGGMLMQRGGTPQADAALGRITWRELARALPLAG